MLGTVQHLIVAECPHRRAVRTGDNTVVLLAEGLAIIEYFGSSETFPDSDWLLLPDPLEDIEAFNTDTPV
jgi:hypothetical protein